jgi:hypothetical protein
MNLQDNTLLTDPPDCLQDIPFLQYIERQAKLNKRITEKIKIGTQLTLACDTSGFFIKKASSLYSIPAIHAYVTVLKNNWDQNNEPHILKLGNGKLNTQEFEKVFRSPGQYQRKALYGEISSFGDSIYHGGLGEEEGAQTEESLIDFEDLKSPIFSTQIGEYEKGSISNNIYGINTLIEKLELQGNSESFLLYSPQDSSNTGEESSLFTFPHKYLSPGTFEGILYLNSFYIRIGGKIIKDVIDGVETRSSLTLKRLPALDFLFNTAFDTSPYNIENKLLYDTEELRYFGGYKDTNPLLGSTEDKNNSWLALKNKILDEEYEWAFSSLQNPEKNFPLKDLVLSLDNTTEDCHAEVLNYLGVTESTSITQLPYIQNWISNTSFWVQFFPVKEYDEEGKALPLEDSLYLKDALINWRENYWEYAGWYKYVPQFLWRVYLDFVEKIDYGGGWKVDPQYMIFNDLTFREALRFYQNIHVEETTLIEDLSPSDRLRILKDFFASLEQRTGVYAISLTKYDPSLSEVEESHQGFFNPTYAGSLSNIPLVILYNHLMVDMTFSYTQIDKVTKEPVIKTGVNLNTDEGFIQFKLKVDSDHPRYVEPTEEDVSNIYQRRPILNQNATLYLRYIVNTTKNFADPLDLNSQIVSITEAGIYNTENKLIAYAYFPPLIYDSYINHLAINWYISNTYFDYP